MHTLAALLNFCGKFGEFHPQAVQNWRHGVVGHHFLCHFLRLLRYLFLVAVFLTDTIVGYAASGFGNVAVHFFAALQVGERGKQMLIDFGDCLWVEFFRQHGRKDVKRLAWTRECHIRFVEAINHAVFKQR